MEILVIMGLTMFAYLLGSISTAIITCKVMGLPDPRAEGSHNPGATNVYQIAGKKAAIITLFGDLLKGLIPVLIARLVGLDELVLASVAMGAFMGHLYPIFYRFKGGKGVATAFGVILGLNAWVALVMLVTWLLVYKVYKLSSLAALVTALLTPFYFYVTDDSVIYSAMALAITVFIFYSHRSNITKILDGTED